MVITVTGKLTAESVVALAKDAGLATLEFYQGDDLGVEAKADDSPLTKADLASHELIMAGLTSMTPDIPVQSEEGNSGDLDAHVQAGGRYWLVDPLDGTKEFIKGRSDYTINIALIDQHQPVAGFIYAPVLNTSWWTALDGSAAFRQIDDGPIETLTAGRRSEDGLYIVSSKSHANEEALADFLGGKSIAQSILAGSSLKFCRVAEGSADLYPRFGPTMEWDTGAGHAIAKAAGAQVIDLTTGKCLRYGKTKAQTGRDKDYLNGNFLVRT